MQVSFGQITDLPDFLLAFLPGFIFAFPQAQVLSPTSLKLRRRKLRVLVMNAGLVKGS